MKILSNDRSEYIEIKRKPEEKYFFENIEDYPFYTIEANFGNFRGFNNSISWHNLDRFVHDLDLYISDRQQKVKLTGTYNFCLEIYSQSNTSQLKLEMSGEKYPHQFDLRGGFVLDDEYLNTYLEDFKKFKNWIN